MENNNFTKDFLWGASISAYQCEGAVLEDGKGYTVQDIKDIPANQADFSVASDFYHHYEEDIELLAEMGINIFRIAISWARIFPTGKNTINQKGIDFYNKVIDKCKECGIEPFVTLFHFDLPLELAKQGGWLNKETVDAFEEYARVCFEHFGDRVKYWLTINEQNMIIMHSGILGLKELTAQENMQQNHHMLLAQAKAMILCHKMCPQAMIGPAPNVSPVYAKTTKPEDVMASKVYEAIRTWLYLDMAVYGKYNHLAWKYMQDKQCTPKIEESDFAILKAAKPDFIAFNYYNTQTVGAYHPGIEFNGKGDQQTTTGEKGVYIGYKNECLEKTEFGWLIDPVGFRVALNDVYSRYRLPIFITENGIGGNDNLDQEGKVHDQYRIEFYRKHIEQMKLAILDGVEVLGYCPWSAIDLVSTHQGFAKRYGFIYVNRSDTDLMDMKRYKKDSFYWYQNIIKTNGRHL